MCSVCVHGCVHVLKEVVCMLGERCSKSRYKSQLFPLFSDGVLEFLVGSKQGQQSQSDMESVE